MAILRRRKIGKKHYYYLEHSYKAGGKVKVFGRYLGSKRPENIGELRKDLEFQVMRRAWGNALAAIKKGYGNELKRLPEAAKQKEMEAFMVGFIYNSDRIEGSRLSLKDTTNLFIHGTTPRNKPLSDVKEAEGHKKAFYDMLMYKGSLNLKKVLSWHKMMFDSSKPDIAGRIRLHKIMVTGSRVSFPAPESLNSMLEEFFLWCSSNKNKYNPVEFASLVHLKFVTIHPFTDGNGRISRLLANFVLYSSKYPMFSIKYTDRMSYYKSLETSQLWEEDKHFIRFFVKKYISYNKKYK
ncbi:Fic family protein [Candidatus Woesearchaeota archaeon]|nr:Fic family protein [Candidatus Woesearchaeota archaeon]